MHLQIFDARHNGTIDIGEQQIADHTAAVIVGTDRVDQTPDRGGGRTVHVVAGQTDRNTDVVAGSRIVGPRQTKADHLQTRIQQRRMYEIAIDVVVQRLRQLHATKHLIAGLCNFRDAAECRTVVRALRVQLGVVRRHIGFHAAAAFERAHSGIRRRHDGVRHRGREMQAPAITTSHRVCRFVDNAEHLNVL